MDFINQNIEKLVADLREFALINRDYSRRTIRNSIDVRTGGDLDRLALDKLTDEVLARLKREK